MSVAVAANVRHSHKAAGHSLWCRVCLRIARGKGAECEVGARARAKQNGLTLEERGEHTNPKHALILAAHRTAQHNNEPALSLARSLPLSAHSVSNSPKKGLVLCVMTYGGKHSYGGGNRTDA